MCFIFFFSSRRRHTRLQGDWSSDVCSSDLPGQGRRDSLSERLECDDGARVLDARDGLHLLVDEMADVGLVLDVEFHQQVEIAGGRIDLGSELGIRELVRHFVGLAELAFDLDEEGNHSRLRAALRRKRQSSKYGCARQGPPACRAYRGSSCYRRGPDAR